MEKRFGGENSREGETVRKKKKGVLVLLFFRFKSPGGGAPASRFLEKAGIEYYFTSPATAFSSMARAMK